MKKMHLKTSQNSLHNDVAGNTKPQKAFRLISKIATELKKKIIERNFLLTD